MPVPTSNQGAESKRWLVPLLANLATLADFGRESCKRTKPISIVGRRAPRLPGASAVSLNHSRAYGRARG